MRISKQTTYFCDTSDDIPGLDSESKLENVWVQVEDDNSVTLCGFDGHGYQMSDLFELADLLRTIHNRHCYPLAEAFLEDDDNDEWGL